MKLLTLATRGGDLAIKQTQIVISALQKAHPQLRVRIRRIRSQGDKDRHTTLWKLTSSGFFTSLVEEAVLSGQADIAVHSFKDLPTGGRDGLYIAAVCDRKFAADCVLADGQVRSLDALKASVRIGTCSLRRAVQMKRLRPDVKVEPIRGNVTTRIKRLDRGEFGAIILARAGLERLGISSRLSFCLSPEQFLPAPAQGALAVQVRCDDIDTRKMVAAIDDPVARLITGAERQILVATECGCRAPVGAFARITGEAIVIHAFISDPEGTNFIRRSREGPAGQAKKLADALAGELLRAGGREIVRSLRN